VKGVAILGNGPSVRDLARSLRLRDLPEPTIGLNRSFFLRESEELVVADLHLMEDHELTAIAAGTRVWGLDDRCYVSQQRQLEAFLDLVLLRSARRSGLGDGLWGDIRSGYASVRCSWHYALQVAEWMGAEAAVLLGCDLAVGEGLSTRRPFTCWARDCQMVLAHELAAWGGMPIKVYVHGPTPLAEAFPSLEWREVVDLCGGS
jgi:hypothetical protein